MSDVHYNIQYSKVKVPLCQVQHHGKEKHVSVMFHAFLAFILRPKLHILPSLHKHTSNFSWVTQVTEGHPHHP